MWPSARASRQPISLERLNYSVLPWLVGPRLAPAICRAHASCWNRQPKGYPHRIPSAGDTAIAYPM